MPAKMDCRRSVAMCFESPGKERPGRFCGLTPFEYPNRVNASSPSEPGTPHPQLRGFPQPTVQAYLEFQKSGTEEAFSRALAGIIEHHLRQPPPKPVSEMPGSTNLVSDLGLDSITMVELAFLFEDLFAAKLPQEEYVKVHTLDELRTLLLGRIRAAKSA